MKELVELPGKKKGTHTNLNNDTTALITMGFPTVAFKQCWNMMRHSHADDKTYTEK